MALLSSFLRLLILAAGLALAANLPASAQELSAERIAQHLLLERGYDIGAADGIWGPRSAAAMTDLQSKLGLPQTGMPDASTLEALAASPQGVEFAPEPDGTLDAPPAGPSTTGAEPAPTKAKTTQPAGIDLPDLQPTTEVPAASLDPPSNAERPGPGSLLPPPGNVDPLPLLLGLAVATGFGALVIYVFFSVRERHHLQRVDGLEPALHPSTRSQQHSPANAPPTEAFTRPDPRPAEVSSGPTLTAGSEARIHQHNAAVDAVVQSRAAIRPIVPSAPADGAAAPAKQQPPRSSPWVPGHEAVLVGNHRLRGFIYVGETLKPQNGWSQRDNCLVVPSLPLAARADVTGQYLDYWPSYERLSPSSRRAYLDWLASDRDDASTPIGYVFLYFYGLERRLMLDRDSLERDAILAEVERLVGVYGANGSFRRYTAGLISAARAFEGAARSDDWMPIGLGDVPVADRLELGRLVAAGQPIPPKLLLSLVANHPETRLRAPVRRLPQLIAQRFCARVDYDYPEGLKIALPRQVPRLEVTYRAASSTFEVPVIGTDNGVPDIAQLTEPLGYGRDDPRRGH